MVTRGFDVNSPVVISITFLQAGCAFNIIPSEVVLAGTVRTVDPVVRAEMPARIEHLARHTAAAFGASCARSRIRTGRRRTTDSATRRRRPHRGKHEREPHHSGGDLAACHSGESDR
jgi:metal-dependent amidase/aminoacylase/carboxypeptidase family protein